MTRHEAYDRGIHRVWRLIVKGVFPHSYLRDYKYDCQHLLTVDERQAEFFVRKIDACEMARRVSWLKGIDFEAIPRPTLTQDEAEEASQKRYDMLVADLDKRVCKACGGTGGKPWDGIDIDECSNCNGSGLIPPSTKTNVRNGKRDEDILTDDEMDAAFYQALSDAFCDDEFEDENILEDLAERIEYERSFNCNVLRDFRKQPREIRRRNEDD